MRPELVYPIAESTETSDDQSRRAEKDERHRLAIQAYNEELRRRKAEDNAKFNGLQIGDIDKKLKSQLNLALGREGQKFFGRRQKDNESLKKFHETLSELAKNCKLGELESELVRDIFITNMRNVEIQKKLFIEY